MSPADRIAQLEALVERLLTRTEALEAENAALNAGYGMTQPAKRSAKAEILKLPISSRKEVAVGRVAAATS